VSQPNRPMIVGAGPVGLGAALFLARQGQAPRVVEMRNQPSQQSKALAVNPRTLDILEPTGLTRRMLELGLPIYGVRFYLQGRIFAVISFENIHPRYPFMLALSQAVTERLLAQAFEAAGGVVERGVQMLACRTVAEGVEAVLESTADGFQEIVRCPWLLAADGAHSVARQQLRIDFGGTSFAEEWHLADVPLRTGLAHDYVHIFFLAGGTFLFLLRVVDEARRDKTEEPLWRVLANRPEPLSWLVQTEQAGLPTWTSSFHISHRIDATLAAGCIYFAGDAAHIHSPVGARGMNLGLEDAWVFAGLVRANRLADYNRLRRPVDAQVVRRVELLSRIVSPESGFYRLMRTFMFPITIKIPFLRDRMVATVTGLDHELPDLTPVRRKNGAGVGKWKVGPNQ
jgi:2-polyprenyl-6-methoxyphenol hydroxylase-like FAD-dependent oxidoreductase